MCNMSLPPTCCGTLHIALSKGRPQHPHRAPQTRPQHPHRAPQTRPQHLHRAPQTRPQHLHRAPQTRLQHPPPAPQTRQQHPHRAPQTRLQHPPPAPQTRPQHLHRAPQGQPQPTAQGASPGSRRSQKGSPEGAMQLTRFSVSPCQGSSLDYGPIPGLAAWAVRCGASSNPPLAGTAEPASIARPEAAGLARTNQGLSMN